jgi:hypothetical protein
MLEYFNSVDDYKLYKARLALDGEISGRRAG